MMTHSTWLSSESRLAAINHLTLRRNSTLLALRTHEETSRSLDDCSGQSRTWHQDARESPRSEIREKWITYLRYTIFTLSTTSTEQSGVENNRARHFSHSFSTSSNKWTCTGSETIVFRLLFVHRVISQRCFLDMKINSGNFFGEKLICSKFNKNHNERIQMSLMESIQ